MRPVRRSPVGASMPPTIDPARPGTYRPLPVGGPRATFRMRRDAANRDLSGRRPRTFDRTPELAKGGHRRSRSKVTSRATMSDRPRPGTRPAGLIASSSNESPPTSGGDRRFRRKGRRATAAVPVRGGSAGPVHVFRWRGAGAMYDVRRPTPAIGNPPHCPGTFISWGMPAAPAAILRAFPGRVEAARTGEVLRSRDQGASSVP